MPTYLFVGGALLMIAIGAFRIVVLGAGAPPPNPIPGAPDPLQPMTIFLLLRAFAGGSVALTGTEAIANGVPAFKPSESRNAATTLTWMAILLGTLFIGITFLANGFGIVPVPDKTVISQVATAVYGSDTVGFYLFQGFTALILILAANTSYNAFPRLAAIVALDSYMPRHFSFRGDRLAYTLGIAILSGLAITLVILFGGDTHALIPLYSVGVFVSFTLSQGGMVRHWHRVQGDGWRRRLATNAVGCALTAVVSVVVLIEKAPSSLLVAVIIPTLVLMMLFIHRQYQHTSEELKVRPDLIIGPPRRQERAVIPVPGLDARRGPGRELRSSADRRRADGARHRRRRGGRAAPGAHGAPDPGRAVRDRRVPLPVARPALRDLPRRHVERSGRDHARRHPRVRGTSLVGAAAVQPDVEPAARRAARPAEHRRRERPVPARGAGAPPSARRRRHPEAAAPGGGGCAASPGHPGSLAGAPQGVMRMKGRVPTLRVVRIPGSA